MVTVSYFGWVKIVLGRIIYSMWLVFVIPTIAIAMDFVYVTLFRKVRLENRTIVIVLILRILF